MNSFTDPFGSEGSDETLSRDVLFNMLFLFVMLLLIMFVQEKQQNKKEAEGTTAPGNVIVEMVWDPKLDADVDLWVLAPEDVPIGYSNKSGKIFSLLRDDLGRAYDITEVNMEFAYSRGMPAGEYVVNVHLYKRNMAPLPLQIDVAVRLASVNGVGGQEFASVASKRVLLTEEGQELTVMRFRIGSDGQVVAGSLNSIPRALRSAASASASAPYRH